MDDALPLDLFGNVFMQICKVERIQLCSGTSLLPSTHPFQLWPVLIVKALYRVLHAFGLQDEKETTQVPFLNHFVCGVTRCSMNRFPYCTG